MAISKISPSWVRTSDLQVNSLTRYRLRHGGTMALNYYCIQQHNVAKVTSDGIEPPLSDLESEVLPLHHEASWVIASFAAKITPK